MDESVCIESKDCCQIYKSYAKLRILQPESRSLSSHKAPSKMFDWLLRP